MRFNAVFCNDNSLSVGFFGGLYCFLLVNLFWNYTALVDVIHNGEGKCWTTMAFCEEELIEAIEKATGAKKDCLCFIEVIVHKDDTSKELLEWGSRVSAANSRPPSPQ